MNMPERACVVLRTNDRNGCTVPTAQLYPCQSNSDTAFVSIG